MNEILLLIAVILLVVLIDQLVGVKHLLARAEQRELADRNYAWYGDPRGPQLPQPARPPAPQRAPTIPNNEGY